VNGFAFPAGRPIDLLCLGRAGVDFYAQQDGVALEDVTGFRKSVGGSPANVATALARLGGRAAILSVVSDDGFGRYVRRFLADNGVDVTGLKTAPVGALNSAAFTEMRPDGCQVIIYRRDAADLHVRPADIDPALIARARALLVTGTALSASPSREAALHAIDLAQQAGTVVVLDLDHRPYGWTDLAEACVYLRLAGAQAQIVIGNREEFDVLEHLSPPAERDDHASARRVLRGLTQVAVVKDGARGCRVFQRDGSALRQGIYPVQVRKPFGSGDAFAGAMLWALFDGRSWAEAARCGAAAAALNVSRDACAEAMASRAELLDFMARNPAPDNEAA
jgi:5-dehydro-2-deoxygluconokinase